MRFLTWFGAQLAENTSALQFGSSGGTEQKIGGMKLSCELRARSTRSAGRDLVDQACGHGKWQLVGKILAGYPTKFQI